jgi:coenzyme F420-reducing hydrogenase alpha subunit
MTRLIIDPLTRVEGHGRIELLIKDGRLQDVTVRLLESPRLFEKLVVGRRYDEVPDLICRICAICSAVHKLASLQALENAMAVTVPPIAVMLRELLLLGGHIQSHALHLFCLVLPDLCGTPDVLALLRKKDPLAQSGLALKAFGNRIQEVAGGRVIHPVNPVFGGVAYCPPKTELESLLKEVVRWQRGWLNLEEGFAQIASYPVAQLVLGTHLAMELTKEFSLNGERLCPDNGASLPVADYVQLLDEKAVPYSYAKEATGQQGPFVTGAIVRLRQASCRGIEVNLPSNETGIHGNNQAQLWEVGWALRRVGMLLELLLQVDSREPLCVSMKSPCGGTGTSAIEAPRGLLIHHYVVDEWGMVVAADVVTPTAINQRVMADQLLVDLADERDHDRLQDIAGRIVRAYDPCISCAVHLLEV